MEKKTPAVVVDVANTAISAKIRNKSKKKRIFRKSLDFSKDSF
jgi:hypothetical protein